MKISELINCLQDRKSKYGDIEGWVTWEGTTRDIDDSNLYKSKEGPLYIDDDENCYTERSAIDPKEGEKDG